MKQILQLGLASIITMSWVACGPGGGSSKGFPSPADTAGQPDTTTTPDVVAPRSCQTPNDCTPATPHCAVSGVCLECLTDAHCGDGRCASGVCAAATCQPPATLCSGNTLLTCNSTGNGWDALVCDGGTCQSGACVGCTPDKRVCSGSSVLQCRQDGSGYDAAETCQSGALCADGQCLGCYPGTRRCTVAGVVERCDVTGNWGATEDCAASGMACLQGTCVSPCTTDLKGKSNSGCDYWAVDLDNHIGAQASPFALIVSNLGDSVSTITVSRRDAADQATAEVTRRDVQPGTLEILELPQRHPGGAGIFWRAYRVQSTQPIVAYQFNPLDNVDVFSNDASILLPANTYGTEYIVVSRFELLGGGLTEGSVLPYRGAITVVAPNADTNVTITPTTRTLAGVNMQTMLAGQSYTYTLQPFQVLNIKSDQDGGDLTGTVITANQNVAVFSGHEAAVSSDQCCADHLEQQMLPVPTWGKVYVAAKSFPRLNEKDYWRVVASVDGTTVSFSQNVQPPATLNRGQFLEFTSAADFVITASDPVMVAQTLASSGEIVTPAPLAECQTSADCFLTYTCELPLGSPFGAPKRCFPAQCVAGQNTCLAGHVCACFDAFNCRCSATGDPALIVTPPIEQFRQDYVFLTPNKYADDFINIIAPTTGVVVFDGVTLPAGNFNPLAGSDWKVARLKVTDGVHTITASAPVGVIAYGYDRDVSYGYAAGMNLSDL